jgi:ketosteroid isomerase-like protein
MKNANQIGFALTAAFILAVLVTPMSAQTRTGILPTSVETTVSKTPTTTTSSTVSLTTVTAAVDAQISSYERALNTENSTAVATTVDATVVISEPDGSSRTLPESEFLKLLKDAFSAAGKEIIDLYGYEVQLIGEDGARVLGSYTVSVMDEKGTMTNMVRSGRFIYVFRKTAEGWVIREMTDFPN